MSEPPPPRPEPTGHPEVDAALSDLDEVDMAPLAEQHQQLARAHERLHAALDRGDPTA